MSELVNEKKINERTRPCYQHDQSASRSVYTVKYRAYALPCWQPGTQLRLPVIWKAATQWSLGENDQCHGGCESRNAR
jgi:hypothetical protein